MAISLAQILDMIQPSPTLAISDKAAKMKAEGIDVISLSTGEPDFDTPESIKDDAIKAIQAGKTKYTVVDGTKELKIAIIHKFKRDNNLDYALDQITVGNGAKQVIFNAFIATLNPGDEVIIPAPYWVSYPEMVAFAQGKVVIIECGLASAFKLTPSALEAAITPKTKWLILNSPSNPNGATYSKEELGQISAVLIKYPHVAVLCDDIYEHIIFDNFKFYTLAQVEPRLYDRILTVNGVSKGYAMTGWRIGYAGGPKELIKAIAKVQSQSTSNPCSISQAAAVEALTGPRDFLANHAAIFQSRSDYLLNRLLQIKGIECYKPEGAFYLFPSCDQFFGKQAPDGKVINNSLEFADYLLNAVSVAVVPGSAFGTEGFFRLSYATSQAQLEKACDRIKRACEQLANP